MANTSLLHVLIAIALAVAIVVLPMGHIMMAIPWIIVVTIASKREARRGRGKFTFAIYAVVTLSIIVAAVIAPVKTTDRVLNRRLTLPKTEWAIAELDRETNVEHAEWLPQYIHVATTPEKANQRIRFRSTDITLGEFIDTIESQTELRHRFMHCGNGSTILFGGDCCFGLRLR